MQSNPGPDRRVAMVTGGGSGIGELICRILSERGWAVSVADIDATRAARVAEEIGGIGVEMDVTESRSIEAAANATESTLGPIDTWISNAGISTMDAFVDITQQDWDHVLAVNVKGPFLCGQIAARRFIQRGTPAVIVNVASMAGKRGAAPYLAHYVASKFAVVGLTQAMALELAPHQIRVNCVCPGYVATGMQQRELAWEATLRDVPEERVRDLYLADTPLGRIETPDDVARAVAFLVGPDAAFITGEALAVNGGAFMD